MNGVNKFNRNNEVHVQTQWGLEVVTGQWINNCLTINEYHGQRQHKPVLKVKTLSKKRSASFSPIREKKKNTMFTLPYKFILPKFNCEMSCGGVMQLKLRYKNLYVPSNFVKMVSTWVNEFPLNRPFTIPHQVHNCSFHIFPKEVDCVFEDKQINLHPLDFDYRFSAKVMLLSLPTLEEFYNVCLPGNSKHDHPENAIKFLVGLSDQNMPMAIGGAWSPSLDGPNPESDPAVLIKTAIRTCHALIGLDLSKCTRWNPFFKLDYSRRGKMNDDTYKTETVIIYVPDVWNCMWTNNEWETLVSHHNATLEKRLSSDEQQRDIKPDSKLLEKQNKHYKIRVDNEKNSTSENSVDTSEKTYVTTSCGLLTKEKLKKAYELPDKPRLLVYPHRTFKSGKFNCQVSSLAALLNYPNKHLKEHSFEVYLFCELFKEMLFRDFGYNVFKSIVLTHVIHYTNSTNGQVRKLKACKKNDCGNIVMPDRFDLRLCRLSFSFFDINSVGYVLVNDLEYLFHFIGLELSKDQVRKLFSKVQIHSNKIHYQRILKELNEYYYDGLVIFQDPKAVIMDIFYEISIKWDALTHKFEADKQFNAKHTAQKSEPKCLQSYLNRFKEELATMKANLAEMKTVENNLCIIMEEYGFSGLLSQEPNSYE